MAKYIEREKLYQELHNAGGCDAPKNSWADGWDKGISEAIRLLTEQPTADVVEVVRCKDCKYWHHGYCCGIPVVGDDASYVATEEMDYCNYGEAKTDGKGEDE